MNYYPRYPGDYLTKTVGLSMIEDGAYTRLLDWYYSNEEPIPHARRYAIARAITAAERAAVDAVLAKFFRRDGDVHRHGRADEEIVKATKRIGAAQANGKKGGRKPKDRPDGNPAGSPPDNPAGSPGVNPGGNPNPTQDESSPTPTPETPQQASATATVAERARIPDPPAPSAATRLRLAMIRGGVLPTSVNPGDPRIDALAEQGATEAEVEAVAREAVRGGKGIGWIVAAVQGRREDAARIALAPASPPPAPSRGDADATAEMLAQMRRDAEAARSPEAVKAREAALAAMRSRG